MDSSQLTLQQVLRRAELEYGDRTLHSVTSAGMVEQTLGETVQRAMRLTDALHGMGISKGDVVGTICWNHHRHLELYLAVTCMGAVLHTINPRLATSQIIDTCRHARDEILFIDDDILEHSGELTSGLPELKQVIITDHDPSLPEHDSFPRYEDIIAGRSDDARHITPLAETMPAIICYSSATTGHPKGVVYSHRALTLHTMMLGLADTWALSEADTILPIVPMFHVNAWGIPLAALWFGSRLVLPGRKPTAESIVELMDTFDVSFSAAVPTVWLDVIELLQKGELNLPSMRLAVSGGAPLSPKLAADADNIGLPLIQSYGMTEASPLVLVNKPKSSLNCEEANLLRTAQGYVVPGVDYQVVDKDGHQVPRDGQTPGQLLLKGPWIAESYFRDAKRSDSTFVDGWYRTGDLVTVTEHGYVRIVDRRQDLIKSGGEWISSIEIEAALSEHRSITSAAVVSVKDERWQERPIAYVIGTDVIDEGEIKSFLNERLPRFWIPDRIIAIDELPVTSVGKVDKTSLRRLCT